MLDSKSLAINGGPPVRTKPWLENLTLGEEELNAAVSTIRQGTLSYFEGTYMAEPPFSFWGGPKVQELETLWAEYYGAPYAVSMNSATSGLYAAVGALGLGYGDEVIVSPYTMSASATCALVYGAIPVFADVDIRTGCLDPDSILDKVSERTKAIVVVHQFGIPAEMDKIMGIAQEYNLKVIEDCAQAHGAKYRGQNVGTIGDIGVFSLNVNKSIQVGEGCVCLTKDEEVRFRLALIRNHGEAVVEAAQYQNIANTLGFNYRLTEVGAAMAIEQLKKVETFNKLRLEFVDLLNHCLDEHAGLIAPPTCSHAAEGDGCRATYYVYPVRFLEEEVGVSRGEFVEAVNAEGVKFYQGYVRPLYLQPLYQNKIAFKHGYPFSAPENRGSKPNYALGACPVAEELHFNQMLINEHVRFPHSREDMLDIIRAVEKIVSSIGAH